MTIVFFNRSFWNKLLDLLIVSQSIKMNFRGLNIILIILALLVGAFVGQILFSPTAELSEKLFVLVFEVVFATNCAVINDFLNERDLETWKRRLGYI